MKYLITESQIDRVIFKYLDNQDFIIVEKNNIISFVNSENDKYVQIRFDRDGGWCSIERKLMEEVASFFSILNTQSLSAISMWSRNKIGLNPRAVEARQNIPARF